MINYGTLMCTSKISFTSISGDIRILGKDVATSLRHN
jgi:hypothetical protein